VDVKRARTRYSQAQPTTHPNADSKKIFVGGLGDIVTKADLTVYFEKFGTINDTVVMYERVTRRPRGFGFVTFDSKEAVDKVLEIRFHDLNGIKVETKMAEPREHSRYQHTCYHGSMSRGYQSPSNSYAEMTPIMHDMPYLYYNGTYYIPAFPYGPLNHGYMMNY
jgi:RNA-binding protein Musashi